MYEHQTKKNIPCVSARMSNIRAQLVSVGESFVGFDKSIAEDAKRRRGREAAEAREIEAALLRLTEEVTNEVRARVYDVRDLQKFAEAACNAMLESIQDNAIRQIAAAAETIEATQGRILTLERAISQFKGDLPSKLQVDAAALFKEAAAAKLAAEQMKGLGRKIEAELAGKLEDMAASATRAIEQSRGIAELRFNEAKTESENLIKPRNCSEEEKFRDFILQEFSAIKTAMVLETEQRQKSDTEILDAIQFYSDALRRSIAESRDRRLSR